MKLHNKPTPAPVAPLPSTFNLNIPIAPDGDSVELACEVDDDNKIDCHVVEEEPANATPSDLDDPLESEE